MGKTEIPAAQHFSLNFPNYKQASHICHFTLCIKAPSGWVCAEAYPVHLFVLVFPLTPIMLYRSFCNQTMCYVVSISNWEKPATSISLHLFEVSVKSKGLLFNCGDKSLIQTHNYMMLITVELQSIDQGLLTISSSMWLKFASVTLQPFF